MPPSESSVVPAPSDHAGPQWHHARRVSGDTQLQHHRLRNRWQSHQTSGAGILGFLERLLIRATESDVSLQRYLTLFRFARWSAVAVVIALLVGSMIFGAGVAVAVTVAGLHTGVAIGIGAGGSATFILTLTIQARRYLKVVLRALSAIDRHDSMRDSEVADETDNQQSAA